MCWCVLYTCVVSICNYAFSTQLIFLIRNDTNFNAHRLSAVDGSLLVQPVPAALYRGNGARCQPVDSQRCVFIFEFYRHVLKFVRVLLCYVFCVTFSSYVILYGSSIPVQL